MADLKISGLTDGAPAEAADIVPVARGLTTRRLSLTNIITLLGSTFAALVHTHAESDVTNLVADLAAKGDFSSNTGTSVDSEVVVFSGTGGKTGKRATGTGPAKLASGVLSAAAIDLSGAEATGTLAAGRFPALTGPVTTSAGALGTAIANNAITTAMITDANVTKAKIENVAASKLLGRGDSGAGAPQEITLGSNLTMTGTTLAASGGGNDSRLTIVNLAGDQSVIDSITGVECAGLQATATGTGKFSFRYTIRYLCTVSTVGIKFGVNHTGTATVVAFMYGAGAAGAYDQTVTTPPVAMSASATRAFSTTSPDLGPSVSVDTGSALMLMIIEGSLFVTADGDFELWFACETLTGDGTVTILEGSSLVMIKTA